jgi:hypothetical protein
MKERSLEGEIGILESFSSIFRNMECWKGLCAKCREIGFSRNYFVKENPVERVHKSMDLVHRWCTMHQGWQRSGARQRVTGDRPELGSGGRGITVGWPEVRGRIGELV